MLARAVRDSETQQLTWQRITGDSGAAGAIPLGAILAIFSNTVPEGFLPCNGAAYDITTYIDLYELLGTSTLPDFRECSLVGIGENSTDTFTTPHDIYTLGQFKDAQTGGTVSAGYTVSGSNLVLNNDATLGAANRKLIHQYITNANATDLVVNSSVTRARSKGVNFVIKAVPGMETTDITDALALINERLALTLAVKAVDTLPTGADIGNYLYYYDYSYYAPTINTSDPSLNYLTRLANFSEIQPVIEWLASTDPLPTGSAIKEHLYAQEYTTAGGDTKYHYYIGKVDSSDPLNNELVALETGAGASIFVGTQAEWDLLSAAEKNEYQQANLTDVNSVVHVPVDVVADGNMNPPTSNAVFDSLYLPSGTSSTLIYRHYEDTVVSSTDYNFTHTETIATSGWYRVQVECFFKENAAVVSNSTRVKIGNTDLVYVTQFNQVWIANSDSAVVPLKAGTVVSFESFCQGTPDVSRVYYNNVQLEKIG